jgi:hypothetical protein
MVCPSFLRVALMPELAPFPGACCPPLIPPAPPTAGGGGGPLITLWLSDRYRRWQWPKLIVKVRCRIRLVEDDPAIEWG